MGDVDVAKNTIDLIGNDIANITRKIEERYDLMNIELMTVLEDREATDEELEENLRSVEKFMDETRMPFVVPQVGEIAKNLKKLKHHLEKRKMSVMVG